MIGDYRPHYPDECLYSGCARCYELLPYNSRELFLETLFNDGKMVPVVDLPSHLEDMVRNLQEGHYLTVETIINEATLLPYYAPFLPPARYVTVRNNMIGRGTEAIQLHIGSLGSSVKRTQYMRYCPECVIQDRKLFHEAYWHRLHQIPGIIICPEHHVYIEDSTIPFRMRTPRNAFISAERSNLSTNPKSATQHPHFEILLKLAKTSMFLLEHPSQPVEFEKLQKYYRSVLYELGYATFTGRLFVDKLINDFENYYSKNLLMQLGCGVREATDNWLLRLLNVHIKYPHPIRHLLVMTFLNIPISAIYQRISIPEPFGSGPWPCLNPVCNDYLQLKIFKFEVRAKPGHPGKPVALFSCKCSYQYEIADPNAEISRYQSLKRVVCFGSIWEGALINLWNDLNVNFTKMGKILDVDPITVVRHAIKLGLNYPREIGRDQTVSNSYVRSVKKDNAEITNGKREEYREKWKQYVEEHPDLSNNQLRKLFPNVHNWLRNHDKEWLSQNGTGVKKERTIIHHHVNWNSLDEELCNLVIGISSDMKRQSGKPIFICRTAIAKLTGHYSVIIKNPDKLPKTIKALDASVETREEYSIRKIYWAYKMFCDEGVLPRRWQVIDRANVLNFYKNDLVAECLDNLKLRT